MARRSKSKARRPSPLQEIIGETADHRDGDDVGDVQSSGNESMSVGKPQERADAVKDRKNVTVEGRQQTDESELLNMGDERATRSFYIRRELVERVRRMSYWTPELSVNRIVETALSSYLSAQEGKEDRIFNPKTKQIVVKAAGEPWPPCGELSKAPR